MIALEFLLLLASGLIFLLLRGRNLRLALALSILFFVAGTLTAVLLLHLIGDPPPEGTVPLTREALEKEGMTKAEWEEYQRSHQMEPDLEE